MITYDLSITERRLTTGAPAFYAATLTAVRTLRGPAVAAARPRGPPYRLRHERRPGEQRAARPGRPAVRHRVAQGRPPRPRGPTLRLAPIVGPDVPFSPWGCWDLTGLQPDQYQASTPLRPVPTGPNVGGEHQAAENGLYTVPLATVEQVAASA